MLRLFVIVKKITSKENYIIHSIILNLRNGNINGLIFIKINTTNIYKN